MRTGFFILICFYSSLFISNFAQAEVYKWVDDQGVVHYGDKRSDGKKAKEMQVDTTTPTASAKTGEGDKMSRDEKRRRIADAMEEDRLQKKETRQKKKAESAKNRKRCNQLKDKSRRLKNAAGLYKLDKDGNRVILSGEQRSKNENDLNNQIKKYCR